MRLPSIRGWCPSLHEPMATGDGLLVRVKPPLGLVPAAAARALADAAMAHGNGAIELTGRGALQFRGLSRESAPRFAATVVELGLAAADAAVERRRSILVSPLAGCDPAVDPGTAELAEALEAAIVRDDGLAALPAKFGFAVDGGGALPLGNGADITLTAGRDRCMVALDGAGQAAVVDHAEAVAAVVRVAHAFVAVAGGERRMRLVPGAQVFAAAGLVPMRFEADRARVAVGLLRLDKGVRAFGAGLPFGAMGAELLATLADLAERAGDGIVRLTPWRCVLIAGEPDPSVLAALGLITAADDPLLRVSACPGQPGCESASVGTRALASGLRPRPGVDIHVSGCSKGCAHPGAAALTFVGRDGRYDLVREGRADDMAVRRGLTPDEVTRVR